MPEIVAHVITAEGEHGHRVSSYHTYLVSGGSSGLRTGSGTREYAVLPVKALYHQGYKLCPSCSKDYRRDGHTLGVIEFPRECGAVIYRYCEPGIGMCCICVQGTIPGFTLPVHHILWYGAVYPFPPGLVRSEEHTSELQSQSNLVCRLLLEKKK